MVLGCLEQSQKINNKAQLFADSIRNDYLLNDQKSLLQKIQIAKLSHEFFDIEILPAAQNTSQEPRFFIIKNVIPILSIPEQKNSSVLANVIFMYSLLPGLTRGSILWFAITLIVAILLPYLRSNLEEIISAKIELQKMKELHQIASSVAHDIRSPLSALNNIAATIGNSNLEQSSLIKDVVNRINDIANDLLIRSKDKVLVQSFALPGTPSCLVNQTIESLVKEKVVEFRSQSSEIDIVIRPTQVENHVIVPLSKNEFSRVLSNLINNAIEASTENKSVYIETSSGDRSVRIIVTDFGVGIPPEVLERLSKEPISYGKEGAGNGIGVFNASQILNKVGGSISIQSKVGVGTQVILTIPVVQ